MSAQTGKKASANWAGLCRIYVELDDPNHPLRCVPMNREAAIANAVRSGSFPVRGHRCIDGCAGDAFERIDNRLTPDAEVSVYMSTITIKLPPLGISIPLPSAFSPSPRRIKYVDVEADRGEVETWIRENAVPAGWISAAGPTPYVDQRNDAESAAREYLSGLPRDAPVKIKKEFYREINDPDHELYETCGKMKLSERALEKVWSSAPAAWRRGGRRPANRQSLH